MKVENIHHLSNISNHRNDIIYVMFFFIETSGYDTERSNKNFAHLEYDIKLIGFIACICFIHE